MSRIPPFFYPAGNKEICKPAGQKNALYCQKNALLRPTVVSGAKYYNSSKKFKVRRRTPCAISDLLHIFVFFHAFSHSPSVATMFIYIWSPRGHETAFFAISIYFEDFFFRGHTRQKNMVVSAVFWMVVINNKTIICS